MGRRKIAMLLVAGALTMAAAFGVFTYRSVYAQAPTPTPGTPAKPGQRGELQGDFHRGGPGGISDQDLADALGIEMADLQAAQEEATTAAINQAVSDGLITQAQADQLLANGVRGRHGLGWLTANGIDYEALLADALGIRADELQAAREEAFNTNLDQAVQDGTLTEEQANLIRGERALFSNDDFQTSMRSAFEAAVQQAVTNGVITQAQADQILQNTPDQFFGRGGFRGPRGGGRHGGPWGGGFPADPGTTPIEPSTGTSGL